MHNFSVLDIINCHLETQKAVFEAHTVFHTMCCSKLKFFTLGSMIYRIPFILYRIKRCTHGEYLWSCTVQDRLIPPCWAVVRWRLSEYPNSNCSGCLAESFLPGSIKFQAKYGGGDQQGHFRRFIRNCLKFQQCMTSICQSEPGPGVYKLKCSMFWFAEVNNWPYYLPLWALGIFLKVNICIHILYVFKRWQVGTFWNWVYVTAIKQPCTTTSVTATWRCPPEPSLCCTEMSSTSLI